MNSISALSRMYSSICGHFDGITVGEKEWLKSMSRIKNNKRRWFDKQSIWARITAADSGSDAAAHRAEERQQTTSKKTLQLYKKITGTIRGIWRQ